MAGGFRIILSRQRMAGPPAQMCHDIAEPPVFAHPAISVWSDEPCIQLGDHGCIIGRLFTRELPSRRVKAADEAMIADILRSEGRSLLASHWGGYVLALVAGDGRTRVMRDPSGLLPCYFRRETRTIRIASDITDVARRGSAAVDFMELTRYLVSADAPGSATCVAGAEELVPGQALILERGHVDLETCWSPWDHVAPADCTPGEAADAVRRVALDCVGSWADCFGSVLLGVSGGLDSSIVAAGARGRTQLACLTHVGPDAEGDERRYAQALTRHLDLELSEGTYRIADIDLAKPVAPHHPFPNAHHFRQAVAAMQQHVMANAPIDAIFSGNGGDGIFCGMRSATPLVDRYLAEGVRGALWKTLRDLSDLTGADAATILRHAWRKYRAGGRSQQPSLNRLGLAPDRLRPIIEAGPRHPWYIAPDDALPGKRTHVAFLVRSLRSLELYPRRTSPPHVAPLMSQPLVELCLAIPTWQWIDGGRDRSIARAAFEHLLPPMVLRRVHKGGPSGFTRDIYNCMRAEAIDLLRGGRLVGAHILDPAFPDEPDDPEWRSSQRPDRLLALVAAETWARWWLDDDLSS